MLLFFTGAHIDYSLNKTVAPCDDFYEFSCGGWVSKTTQPSSEPVWSYWQTINSRIKERLQTILELPSDEHDIPLTKAKLMYKACRATNNSRRYIHDLKDLIARLGGWPLAAKDWNGTNFDWTMQIATVRKLTGVQTILKMFPEIDFANTSNHILYVSEKL